MRTNLIAATALAALTLAGCTQTTQRDVGGAVAGAAVGAIGAKILQADDDWTLVAALAGATAGVLVARNTATRQCAYANGDGTYYTAACP